MGIFMGYVSLPEGIFLLVDNLKTTHQNPLVTCKRNDLSHLPGDEKLVTFLSIPR